MLKMTKGKRLGRKVVTLVSIFVLMITLVTVLPTLAQYKQFAKVFSTDKSTTQIVSGYGQLQSEAVDSAQLSSESVNVAGYTTTNFVWPTEGTLGDYIFNTKTDYTLCPGTPSAISTHVGIDIIASQLNGTKGNAVYPAYPGKVYAITQVGSVKYRVVLYHEQLNLYTFYNHMADDATGTSYIDPSIAVGNTVTVNTPLGYQGNYNNTNNYKVTHLHFVISPTASECNGIDPSSFYGIDLLASNQEINQNHMAINRDITSRVTGKVTDSGTPVNRAYITFVGGGKTKAMISDSNGNYTIPDVPTGSATIYASNEANTKYGVLTDINIQYGTNTVNIDLSGTCPAKSSGSFSTQSVDYCGGGEEPPANGSCPNYGWYCGGNIISGNSNTLYYCSAQYANPVVSQVCANTCKVNPPGTPDACIGSSSEKVKFYGNSQYSGIPNLELSPGLSNSPSKSTLYKSLQIPSGWSVITYDEDNQKGNNKCFSASDPLLENSGWHNRIESVSISTTNVCPGNIDEGVYLCTNTSYNGTCKRFLSDAPSVEAAGFINDEAESIRIVGNWAATLFNDGDYGGTHTTFEGGVEDLGNYSIGRNTTSSLLIRKRDPSRFSLFAGGDYSSDEFKSDRTIRDLGQWNFNDKAQSIKVDAGYEVIVCEHSNFHGICGRTTVSRGDINSVAPGLRQNVSSVQTCVGTCPPAPSVPAKIAPTNNERIDPGATINFTWAATGREYYVEVTGGALTQPAYYGWGQGNTWTTTLPTSANAYSWRVKAWNDFGESAWSPASTFYVKDIAPTGASIVGPSNASINVNTNYYGYVSPSSAKNLTYSWSPQPLSGQGTATAVYNWTSFGNQTITFKATNSAGSVIEQKIIAVDCLSHQYLTEYFNSKTLSGTPVLKTCENDINHNWDTSTANKGIDYGNGVDGDIVISTDTVDYPIQGRRAFGTQGTNSLTFFRDAQPTFQAGQKIFIHQTRGTNAGAMQYTEVVSATSSVITTKDPLIISFTSTGNNMAQVQVMKQYHNVTVNEGVTWKPMGWNGETGGLLAFYANGTVTINGTITSDSVWGGVYTHAFQGGGTRRNLGCTGTFGQYGESPSGPLPEPPTCAVNQFSNGGGGGSAQSSNNQSGAAGGGGAGHAFNGENGIEQGYTAGQGGFSYDTPDLTLINMGSGGGPGGDPGGYASMGGFGGGVTIIFVNNLSIGTNGFIKMNGANGSSQPTPAGTGGGGGGSGGSILIKSVNASIGNGKVHALGGIGFDPQQSGAGKGGNGSVGIIRLEYVNSLSGQSSPTASTALLPPPTIDNFSVRWTKKLITENGNYSFSLKSDDGAKLWIDNNLLIDQWANGYNETTVNRKLTAGEHNLKVEYYENTGIASIQLDITESLNHVPVWTAIPEQTINEDAKFSTFDLDDYATDQDTNDSLSFTISSSDNLTIVKDANNVVSITPKKNWNGSENITFTAKDSFNATKITTATFKVNPVNDRPIITSTAKTKAYIAKNYTYQVVATDVDNTTLTYSLPIKPDGMTIDSNGLIKWKPTSTSLGSQSVRVRVFDGKLAKLQNFTITVSYYPSDFVNQIDEHFTALSGWTEDKTSGFTSSINSEMLRVVTTLDTNTKKRFSSKFINLEVGQTYYFEAKIRTKTADAPRVYIDLYDADLKRIGTVKTLTAPAGTKALTLYETSYVIPATYNSRNVKFAKIVMESGDKSVSSAANAITWFDDVYFSKVNR
jgi:hypothetical protein